MILKSTNAPVTNEDLKIKQKPASIPLVLVSCGKLLNKNMEIAKVDEKFLNRLCQKCGVKSYKDIIILTLDCNGSVYVQTRAKPAQTFCIKMRGAKW